VDHRGLEGNEIVEKRARHGGHTSDLRWRRPMVQLEKYQFCTRAGVPPTFSELVQNSSRKMEYRYRTTTSYLSFTFTLRRTQI
jgi:hypothetical protein